MKTSYSLYDVIETIGKRPAMYVGEKRLKNIGLFLDGYWIAMHDAGVEDATDPNFADFREFVRQKLNYSGSSAGWEKMILAVAAGCDPRQIRWEELNAPRSPEVHEKSLDLFWELLKEYRSTTDFEPDRNIP